MLIVFQPLVIFFTVSNQISMFLANLTVSRCHLLFPINNFSFGVLVKSKVTNLSIALGNSITIVEIKKDKARKDNVSYAENTK